MADEEQDRSGGLATALQRAPWWAVLLIHLGVPNFITLTAVGVILGLIPSPHLLDKFREMQDAHHQVQRAVEVNTEVAREQTDVLKSIRACMKHPGWKSCD